MAKSTLSFVCQNCGAAYNRWQGKCESCGEWNTLAEEDTTGSTSMPVSIRSKRKGRLFALETLTGKSVEVPRLPSGMAELDRVTGGGFVRGSVLLVGGDPGIGKSTLLTQATSLMARAGHRAVYISGEEAVAQVRLRAERLGLADAPVQLAAETSVEDIVSTPSGGAGAAPDHHRFDPDQVDRHGGISTRHGDTSACFGAGADSVREEVRRRHHPGRPCHKRRPDRGAARGRAHGGCGAVVRRRRLAAISNSARG